MTKSAPMEAVSGRLWQWPVDLVNYECDPSLHEHEKSQLAELAERSETGYIRWHQHVQTGLHRLFLPVQDVLVVTGAHEAVRGAVIRILALEMHRHQTSFWSWTHEDWMNVLYPTTATFREHYHVPEDSRQHLIACAYLLRCLTDFSVLATSHLPALATKVFGQEWVESAVQRVQQELLSWGYGATLATVRVSRAVSGALLMNQSPHLSDLSVQTLEALRTASDVGSFKSDVFRVSRVLAHIGIIEYPLQQLGREDEEKGEQNALSDVPPLWAGWCQRWHETSTLAARTRLRIYYTLLKAGRWLAQTHAEITGPEQWTRDVATEYVAAVDRMTVGEFAKADKMYPEKLGKPISARTKNAQLSAMRVFFQDSQEWDWIPRHFDPRRCFATPRSIRALIAPDPRVIADDIWAKLLWAGLNLTNDDLPASNYLTGPTKDKREPWYPLEMVRAMVVVWLFAGIRSDEFRRLRVGCVRWQREDVMVPGTEDVLPKDAVCWLDVPVHKTGTAFTKAVDKVVGEAIEIWEHTRPTQPASVDPKTGEVVHYLFAYRGQQIGASYLNKSLIPLLCRKANVPEQDARGSITSHRARSTIASQLYNAKEPLSLFDLQEWLGHRELSSTQHYAKKSPTKVAKAYEKAGYFGRNIRMVEVLLDQDAIKSGVVAEGEPWKFYDLGHGYCTYDFFDQCPHRMACAKCSFYRPKNSFQAQLLEGKSNLQRMLQEIPLTEEERAAVEDGITATEKLSTKLAHVATPAGPTPEQLQAKDQGTMTLVPLEQVQRSRRERR